MMSNKKYFLAIIISHLAVIISLFFPLINVDEIRIGISGVEGTETYFINVVEYIQTDIYPLTSIIMISLMIMATFGVVNSVVGIFIRKLHAVNVKLSFIFGFSSAIFAALLLYSSSVVLSLICAGSFIIISVASIRLIKAEEQQGK